MYVNADCVLGFTHQDVVNMFQAIPVDELVTLEVCRGYDLPFDPSDPNTQIIQTVAVTMPEKSNATPTPPAYSHSHSQKHNHLTDRDHMGRTVKSMPDLTNNVGAASSQERQGSPALNQSHSELVNDQLSDSSSILNGMKPELLTISIAKGTMGFGFTIADSAYGQRVKQILDKARCKTLQENDILVEINNRKVKDMVHSDVVNVLKECPRGQNSTILVQRGGRALFYLIYEIFIQHSDV